MRVWWLVFGSSYSNFAVNSKLASVLARLCIVVKTSRLLTSHLPRRHLWCWHVDLIPTRQQNGTAAMNATYSLSTYAKGKRSSHSRKRKIVSIWKNSFNLDIIYCTESMSTIYLEGKTNERCKRTARSESNQSMAGNTCAHRPNFLGLGEQAWDLRQKVQSHLPSPSRSRNHHHKQTNSPQK
jgi:hypothetical protein